TSSREPGAGSREPGAGSRESRTRRTRPYRRLPLAGARGIRIAQLSRVMHRPARHPRRARSRVVAELLVTAVLAFAPAALFAQHDDQREAPEVRDLVLNGVHSVGRVDLERSISTTESQCKSLLLTPFCWLSKSPTFVDKHHLDRTEFRRDVLRILVFYWKRGYRDATVDTAVVRMAAGAVRVIFNI